MKIINIENLKFNPHFSVIGQSDMDSILEVIYETTEKHEERLKLELLYLT